MIIPPRYTLTPRIVELLQTISAAKQVIDDVAVPPEVEQNIRRASTLRSSVFSARIEGNPYTLEEILHAPSKDQKKAEAMNILKSLEFVQEKEKKDLSESEILTMHSIVMKGLIDIDNLGKYRRNAEAIFNSAGIAIYMPPPARMIPPLMARLVKYANADRERIIPIRAALVHYTFERIHPFLDGSGRVGRVVMQKVLAKGGYGMKGLLSLEEYLDQHRSEYYRMLEEPEKDVTDYVTFMLTAIAETADAARKTVLAKQVIEDTDYLLPRRAEILKIIRDHTVINFDSIKRRFSAINERTLRYDLKKLQDDGFIKKLGSTKGVYYSSINRKNNL